MKFESFLLRGLFVVCMMLCAATVGSMLFGTSVASQVAAQTSTQAQARVVEASAITPLACPLLPDGVLCVRAN
ncbi:hypothetical protein [Oleiagrimonas sp. MCCC 1A03011]|uniref:hypothetical protein n=1 Tax=Oleiagrimonas sp. MCCC 1A03011 TaxID=1926883 RepID=UPI000DC32381|nr:hypothetical protein [Oleiagrimonas sp. MCCC 1A03011]RAP57190.1 hypothetical protein BTJ49_11595 [Oleiagrimonas sp. MCCC 1A03011]